MATLWFCLVAVMVATYVVLDGFDLGAGILHLALARTDAERRTVLRTIGPVWDGNEVWLLAGGGALFFAFPPVFATAFSGFYLPLTMAVWLLILRGVAVELRNHVESPVWGPFWDATFSLSSALLAVFFGAALGNVVRGVPLDPAGRFFVPMWTNFRPGADAGVLDAYTVLVGVTALATLAMHGALWIAVKVSGDLQARARRTVDFGWWALAALTVLLTLVTMTMQPLVARNLAARPWGYVFPLVALVGLVGILWFASHDRDLAAFLASCAYIVGMLTSAAFGLYPYLLPSTTDPSRGLTVYASAAPAAGLRIGLAWWVPGMLLVVAYFVFTYRHFAGKVELGGEGY
jgi:cytochrome bd ubiquinol oxidase subunit II